MDSSYKKKNQIFITTSIVVLIIAIFGPIRSSFVLFQDNKAIANKLEQTNEIMNELNLLKKETEGMGRNFIIDVENENIRGEILVVMGDIEKKHKVTFRRLGDPTAYTESDLMIETYRLMFESDFKSSLKTVKFLEENLMYGKISSIKLKSQYDRERRRTELLTEVFIQRIKKL